MRFRGSFARFLTPCFVFRPEIFARACWRKLRARPKRCVVKTAWGDWLEVEPRKFIGAHVYMRGVLELPVCEVLWRLARAGESVVDVGANIGVMTSLLSMRVGERGHVRAFEAHPGVFEQLQQNVRRWNRPHIEVFNRAISDKTRVVRIHEGDGFATNEGTARLEEPGATGRWFEVESITLDRVIPAMGCGVLKVDVEGHEFEVLSGAKDGLAAHRFRDVAFESTWAFPGPAHELLRGYGYHAFAIEASLCGPRLAAVSRRSGPEDRRADYLATVDPRRAQEFVAARGWRVLGVH
jgi:FkbM family methyltransferase